ncbi:winged helix-turn-helix transcriptional regulator [Variovorax sp. PAMC28562]|uniref:MarR family winged helix-turn-helix transcriptional regulator n=1 Tax=Variovorax sp. PAMC28562 TaxID=2762323 RepID=UPI00164E91C5|nr:MarR family winged helix-turn-helix transcriptional regulator [Variovorax sp. PAMC28562]QNK72118.1 winged helix-turn-helix transcriptional regulator [Variovorax sp. PAMC28562]
MKAATATRIEPQDCTNFKLRSLGRVVSRHYDGALTECGLKTSQYSLLSHVIKLGPLRPIDLARAMNVEASTLTRNLKPLLVAGYLTQCEGVDARSRLISITDVGRVKRVEAQRLWRSAQLDLNRILGADRVLALHQLVDDSLELLGADAMAAAAQES